MSAICAVSRNTSPLDTRHLTARSDWESKKMPNDPDANEPGTMPDEELAEEMDDDEDEVDDDEEEDDTDLDADLDDDLIDEDDIAPPTTPRGPR